MTIEKQRMTVEAFERFADAPENADRRFELIDGEIIEMSPSELHGQIASILSGELYIYLKAHPSGRLTIEPRHRIPHDHHNARIPDVAYTSAERSLPIVKRDSVPQMPDLAVEIQSPDDSLKGLRAKAAYYLANGSRMVWLVYPDKRVIERYTADGEIQMLVEGDSLDGGDVLPGFTLPVRDVFAV